MTMPRLDEIRARVELLGLSGVIGITLLVFAFTLYAATLIPMAREVDALRDKAAQLQKRYSMSGAASVKIATPDEQLASFYGFFPGKESTPEWLHKINLAAVDNGIVLRSGEYKMERSKDDRLARYQIILPLTGSYQQIRRFIDMVLKEVPAAALNEVTLQRDSVSSAALEGRVRLTLYLGAP
jgi:Tfp pilus assembly protein PilO